MNEPPQLLPLEMSRYLNRERGCGFVTRPVDQQFVCRRCMEESTRDIEKASKEHFESTAYCRATEGSACAKPRGSASVCRCDKGHYFPYQAGRS